MSTHRRSSIAGAALLLWLATATAAQPLPELGAVRVPPPPGAAPGPFRVMIGGEGPLGEGPGMLLPLMLHATNLSPAQEEKIRTIMRADRERLRALFGQIDQANDALAAKLIGPAPVDAAGLAPEVERITALRTELLKQGLQSALAIRAVLTPEQLEQAARKRARMLALQKEMRELMEE
ncbi:MAG: periplasmic heavy metal sensor [Deltaproteobacteria bacterium]|nr:periplasmic heavy metal sensor [Deltaproteobacteria bacterium]